MLFQSTFLIAVFSMTSDPLKAEAHSILSKDLVPTSLISFNGNLREIHSESNLL